MQLRIREIAHARPRFGHQRIHVMRRREDRPVNKARVRRPYRADVPGRPGPEVSRTLDQDWLRTGPAPVEPAGAFDIETQNLYKIHSRTQTLIDS